MNIVGAYSAEIPYSVTFNVLDKEVKQITYMISESIKQASRSLWYFLTGHRGVKYLKIVSAA
jgi:hypothetical protein